MTTAQTILLSVLALVMIISFISINLAKLDGTRTAFSVIWLFMSAFLFGVALISTSEMNRLEKLNGKCPEYERIDNVYKLKE